MLDLLVLTAVYAGLLVQESRGADRIVDRSISVKALLGGLLCVLVWRVILLAAGVYAPERTRSLLDYLLHWIIGLNSCAMMTGLVQVLLHAPGNLWHRMEMFWCVGVLGMGLVRGALLGWYGWVRPRLGRPKQVIIVGTGQRASQVLTELEADTSLEYRLLGFLDSDPQEGFVPGSMILGGIDDLEKLLTQGVVDEVVIALPMRSHYEAVGYAIAVCQMLGVRSQYLADHSGAVEERSPMRNGTRTPVQAGRVSGRLRAMLGRVVFLQDR